MNAKSGISQERLELIYESALRQFRSGRSLEKIVINLQAKGLEDNEAQNLASKAYRQFMEEEKRREVHESYDKPLIPLPTSFLKTVIRGLFAWVLSILSGHFVNPEHLKKRNEKRIE